MRQPPRLRSHWGSVHPWGNYTLRQKQTLCVISLSWLGRTQQCLIAVACKQWNWSWLMQLYFDRQKPWHCYCSLSKVSPQAATEYSWAVCACFWMLTKENCYTELTVWYYLLEICPCLNSASSLQEGHCKLFQSVELSPPEYSVQVIDFLMEIAAKNES